MFLSKHSGWFRQRAAVLLSLQPDNWAELWGTPWDRVRSRMAKSWPVVLRASSTLGGRCPELIREKKALTLMKGAERQRGLGGPRRLILMLSLSTVP